MNETLGLIPARGGSKRLPRKSLAPLGGVPLIAWTIAAAKASRLTRVVVTTDDDEIASVARQWGAETPFMRPASLAADSSSTLSAAVHALRVLRETEGYDPGAVMILPPTAPFRSAADIDRALQVMSEEGAASVVGVTDVGQYHPYRMCGVRPDGTLEDLLPVEGRSTTSQTFPLVYCRNSSLYLNRTSFFADLPGSAERCFDSREVRPLVMDRINSLDVTDELDLTICEALVAARLTGTPPCLHTR